MGGPSRSVWRVALIVGLGVAVGGLVVLAGPPRIPSPGMHAQKKDKAKKRSEDEDDTPQPARGDVTRIDDPDDKPAKEKPAPASTGNLKQAARETRHPRARALFARLAVPGDEVVIRGIKGVTVDGVKPPDGTFRIAPLVEPFDKAAKGKIEFQVIDAAGEPVRKLKVDRKFVQSIRYHEEIAADLVTTFLEQPFGRYDTSNPLYLGHLAQIQLADAALTGVLQMHQAARESEERKGDAWDKVESALSGQLLKVKLMRLDLIIEANSWDAAFDLTGQLVDNFGRPEDQKKIAESLTRLVEKVLKDPNYPLDRLRELPRRLRYVEDKFAGGDFLGPIRVSLRARARAMFERARELVKQEKMAEATDLLKLAKETWPDLPGLDGYRLKVEGSYQILRVGMRELPLYLSPGWACTDAERRGSELIFESLVSLTPDERGTLYYRPMLATGRPEVIPLGRRFKLSRQAKWSDGNPVTVNDVRETLKRMEGQGSERGPVWRELLPKNPLQVEGDPFRFKFRLGQGLLDPFSAMSFKILPQRARRSSAKKDFREHPIGSGPFSFQDRLSEPGSGRAFAAFVANPHYGARPDRLGKPHIRELRIYAPSDPVKELKDDRLDMVVDLSAEQAAALQKEPGIEVQLPTARTPNRRVYFLAINHRKQFLSNADLRIALARAINRDQLLDHHFRKGLGKKVHRSINGPYPAGSWACNPLLSPKREEPTLDPFDADLAKTKARQALKTLLRKDVTLRLKYPSGDKVLAAAMGKLCEQVNGTLPDIKLVPEPLTPHGLREAVEQTNDFELAYYSYEFPDESYWLMPLLGPVGRFGGDNFLGYTGPLVSKIQQASLRRHFSQVKEYAHAIHRQMLESDMPLIPLWQLDPLIAVHKGRVEMPAIDPQALFTRVEEWRVRGTR